MPPTISTKPLGRLVAVWVARASFMLTGGPHHGHRAFDIASSVLANATTSAAAKPRYAIRFPFLIVRPRLVRWAVRVQLAPDNEMPLDGELFKLSARIAAGTPRNGSDDCNYFLNHGNARDYTELQLLPHELQLLS